MCWTSITLYALFFASITPACAQKKNLNLQSLTVRLQNWLGSRESLNLCSCTPQMSTCSLDSVSTTSASLLFRVPKFQVATLILVLVFFIFFILLVYLVFLVMAGGLHDSPERLDPASRVREEAKPETLPAFRLARTATGTAYRLFHIDFAMLTLQLTRLWFMMQRVKCWMKQSTRWRHQVGTFSALLAFCARNSPATGEFTAKKPVTRSFAVFFDLSENQQWRRRWVETP